MASACWWLGAACTDRKKGTRRGAGVVQGSPRMVGKVAGEGGGEKEAGWLGGETLTLHTQCVQQIVAQ
jgi:hypothetical protein